jgi:RNA polymerase sigma-70 factor, ECF subfamily
MSMHNPATHAQARQQAAYRYESARRELSSTLEQRLNTDTRLATRELDLIVQRRRVMDQTSHMLVPLSRFIEREIRHWADEGRIEDGMVETEDVLMAAIISAQEQLPIDSIKPGMYPWLRRISQKQIRNVVRGEEERATTERSLEAPIRRVGPDWPDRVLLLREVLADQSAVLPEKVIEQSETWQLLEHAVDHLPERWREVFLLRSVDAWDDDEIALAEGIEVEDVELINLAARAYLREYLRESELFQDE